MIDFKVTVTMKLVLEKILSIRTLRLEDLIIVQGNPDAYRLLAIYAIERDGLAS